MPEIETSQLNGIFVIDKPAGMTSASVVARIKKLLGVRKAGHTGTLDPFATGVMICCVNQATKLARFFLHSSKTYEAVLELGVETDTQDVTGTTISRHEDSDTTLKGLAEETIRTVCRQFEGAIEQTPPIYSALKHKGVPLYKLARKGKPVQKPARQIFISSLKIREIRLPEVCFEVSCSGGTYIRTLAADIGASLGCGAYLKALKRIESSGFIIKEAVSLPEAEELVLSGRIADRMIPMADALQGMPVHVADKALAKKIMYGNMITAKEIPLARADNAEGFIRIVDKDNNLLAVITHKKESHRYHYCCVFH
ncbi:tRNA pseudouridine(55) synthase TruB [Desulfococcaceae bacterium HSG8]|nr:tRNA pseudouridine(55) synthase TruB [Desulfococcaceae bacterium HSG8]